MTSDTIEPVPGYSPPQPDHDSAPYWAALRVRRLILQRCTSCQTLRWPFRSVCSACRARTSVEVEVSGKGDLYSWTLIHHATDDTPESLLPYCVALVALDEDPRILIPGQYDGARDELRAGMPVVARYQAASADVTVLHWQRAPNEAAVDDGR